NRVFADRDRVGAAIRGYRDTRFARAFDVDHVVTGAQHLNQLQAPGIEVRFIRKEAQEAEQIIYLAHRCSDIAGVGARWQHLDIETRRFHLARLFNDLSRHLATLSEWDCLLCHDRLRYTASWG